MDDPAKKYFTSHTLRRLMLLHDAGPSHLY